MNPRTIPVKRHPVCNGVLKRIHAITCRRKHAVAAAAATDLENEDHSTRISRGFTIIFLIHVVAIALYFIHLNFLNGHAVESSAVTAPPKAAAAPAKKERMKNVPVISPNDITCSVMAGDNYALIASREGVNENDLREANQNKPIAAGLTLKLPPKRIVAMSPPEVEKIRKQNQTKVNRGMVETTAHEDKAPPRAVVVHSKALRNPPPGKATANAAPKVPSKTAPKATAGKRSYVVRSGDDLSSICKRFKIDSGSLKQANRINDSHKLKTGMTLVIPH